MPNYKGSCFLICVRSPRHLVLVRPLQNYPNSKAPKGDPKGAATLLALELLTGAQGRKGHTSPKGRHTAPKGACSAKRVFQAAAPLSGTEGHLGSS